MCACRRSCTFLPTAIVPKRGQDQIIIFVRVWSRRVAPVENAQVTFIPEAGAPGIGQTDAAGKYTISTRGKNGAVLGANKVTVTKISTAASTMPANPTPEDMMKAAQEANAPTTKSEQMLPNKYGTAFSSGLTAEVTTDESANVFDFELTD